MPDYKLGTTSVLRIQKIDPKLRQIVMKAIGLSEVDFMVIEGLRTPERQAQLYAQGRSTPGPIVTWTKRSKHIDGKAVDLAPVKNGQIDWKDLKAFDKIAEAMFAAAKEVGVEIRWGADWDMDGTLREKGESDSPHFELLD